MSDAEHQKFVVAARADRAKKTRRVLWVVLGLNLLVAVAKFGWGSLSGSMAMANDGVASFFDGISNLVGLVGVRAATRPADTEHPYGHAKYETYASVAIGVALLFATVEIATKAIESLSGGNEDIVVNAGSYSVMGATLLINLAVSFWEGNQGKRLRSEVLAADAKHTRSDAYVSVSVICSLVFVQMGYPVADALVSLLVAFAILASALSIFREASRTLGDYSRLNPGEVARLVLTIDGVREVHGVRSRGTEGEVYVDLHVLMDPMLPLFKAHGVATEAENLIESTFPEVADVVVHMEPDLPEERRWVLWSD